MATTRTSPTVRSSILADLHKEVIATAERVAYVDLPRHFAESGWQYRLRESAVLPMPDATVLVRYDVLVGKDLNALEALHPVPLRLASNPGPVSLAARAALNGTLLYLIFGRLPPEAAEAVAAAAVRQTARPNGHAGAPVREQEIAMPAGDDDVVLPGEAAPRLDEPEPEFSIVKGFEADGIPIMRDPYTVGRPEATTKEVVAAIKRAIKEFLPEARTPAQLLALAEHNPDIIPYVRDLGDEGDAEELREIIGKRHRELAAEVSAAEAPAATVPVAERTPTPRRRAAPARSDN